jgi:hypothetical protein
MEGGGADPAVACTLGPDAGRAQLDEWAKLRRLHQRTETTTGGVRLWFDPAAGVALREVAATEAMCCGFLRLEVVDETDRVRLEITSTLPAARPVIAQLASAAGGDAAP